MSKRVIRGDEHNAVKYDLTALNNLAKQLSHNYILKVGILGNKNARKDGGTTNDEVGATHEFGSYVHKIPMRSFLRMPLHVSAAVIVNAVVKNGMMKLIAAGNIVQIFNNLGVACVGAISDAFATWGFGTWAPLKQATILNKIQNNPAPLVNTRQLERAVSFKVEKV